MKHPKLSIQTTTLVSVGVFLFHLAFLSTAFLKLNSKVWSIYKYHGDAFDLVLFGIYCLTFLVSLAVWFFADAPLSKRFLFAGLLFPAYFAISLVACIIVTHIYSVAVGGY
jgi:hypothetical protein